MIGWRREVAERLGGGGRSGGGGLPKRKYVKRVGGKKCSKSSLCTLCHVFFI
jgi:hypothetical protein